MMSSQDWPDLAGRIDGDRHILPVRVYFEDTDFTGVVYHGSYVRWCERGRSDRLRLHGISHDALQQGNSELPSLAFIVRRIDMKFNKPARIDDLLEVVTTTEEWGGASITLRQTVERDGEVLMSARVQLAIINTEGKPQRLPQKLIDTLTG
jgi:acyl-CoA thioester hydrolase